MKRDMELVRKIALHIEDQSSSFESMNVEFDGFDKSLVAYHFRIMIEGGLIDGTDASDSMHEDYMVNGLTWEGHEFVDSVRSDGIWTKLAEKIKPLGGAVSMDTLKHLAKLVVAESLGIG